MEIARWFLSLISELVTICFEIGFIKFLEKNGEGEGEKSFSQLKFSFHERNVKLSVRLRKY